MSHFKEALAGQSIEANGEQGEEVVSEASQEAALAAKAEGAEVSLQDEINSMEQMMKDMPDMDAETRAIMQGQIEEMKAELGASEKTVEGKEALVQPIDLRSIGKVETVKLGNPPFTNTVETVQLHGERPWIDRGISDTRWISGTVEDHGKKLHYSREYVKTPLGIRASGLEIQSSDGKKETITRSFDERGYANGIVDVVDGKTIRKSEILNDENGKVVSFKSYEFDASQQLIRETVLERNAQGDYEEHSWTMRPDGTKDTLIQKLSGLSKHGSSLVSKGEGQMNSYLNYNGRSTTRAGSGAFELDN